MGLLRQGILTRAEVALSIAGLIDPASEAPPDRPTPPRKRPGPADIYTYFTIKLGAKKTAEQDLKRLLSLSPSKQGPNVARSQIGLGLIAAARRRNDAARDFLQSGLDTIAGEDFKIIETRARDALRQLA